MIEVYNTHTYVNMDILLLTLFFASIKAPASSSNLTTSEWPLKAAMIRGVSSSWCIYIDRRKRRYQIWLSIAQCEILHSYTQIAYYHIQCQIMP